MIESQRIVQGTDWSATVSVTDDFNRPVDLTGAKASFRIELAGAVHACDAFLTDAVAGIITIVVPKAKSAVMAETSVGHGELVLELASGSVAQLLSFPIRLIDAIEIP
jgi:hypothetical protein